MNRLLVILLPPALLAGCAGPDETSRPAPSGDPLTRFESDFRPSDHDTLAAQPAAPTAPAVRPLRDTASASVPAASTDELVQGFRVQILSTTDIDEANQKKLEAESDFPGEWFYIQYDPPTYKLRAGNFLQRYEAERFARLAIDRGFRDSWPVPEKVLRHPPPPAH